jgi:fumarate hydratase class II
MARSTKSTRSSSTRVETDSFGPIEVAVDRHWAAPTERSRHNFRIDRERMPLSIHALGIVNPTAAETNGAFGLPGGELGSKESIHQNDHVDISLSSNDPFPTPMHVATVLHIVHDLVAALSELHRARRAKEKAFAKIMKIGRTHTQEATPLTLGREFSDHAAQLESGTKRLELAVTELENEASSSIVSKLAHGMIPSIQPLAESVHSLAAHCGNDTRADKGADSRIDGTLAYSVDRAPAPNIGCDNAAKTANSTARSEPC